MTKIYDFIPEDAVADPKADMNAAAAIVEVQKGPKLVFVAEEGEPGPHNGGVLDTPGSYMPA